MKHQSRTQKSWGHTKKLGSDTVLRVKPHFEIFLAFKGMFNKARASAALCKRHCSRPSGVQRHPLRLI